MHDQDVIKWVHRGEELTMNFLTCLKWVIRAADKPAPPREVKQDVVAKRNPPGNDSSASTVIKPDTTPPIIGTERMEVPSIRPESLFEHQPTFIHRPEKKGIGISL